MKRTIYAQSLRGFLLRRLSVLKDTTCLKKTRMKKTKEVNNVLRESLPEDNLIKYKRKNAPKNNNVMNNLAVINISTIIVRQ